MGKQEEQKPVVQSQAPVRSEDDVLEVDTVKFAQGVGPGGHTSVSSSGSSPFRIRWYRRQGYVLVQKEEFTYNLYVPVGSVAWITVKKPQ